MMRQLVGGATFPPSGSGALLLQSAAPVASGRIALLLCAVALIGLFSPTSWDGEINRYLELIPLSVFLLALPFLVSSWRLGQLALGAAGLFLLFFFTLISPVQDLALGAVKGYAAVFTLFSARLLDFDTRPRMLRGALWLMNLLLFVLGFGVVSRVEAFQELLREIYSAFEPEVFESMVLWAAKPVASFASHSIAAYFYMLLLILNIETYKATGRRSHLIAGVLFLVLLFLLFSVSGLSFLCIGLVYTTYSIYRVFSSIGRQFFVLLGLMVFGLVLFTSIDAITETLSEVFLSRESGLLGRYAERGVLTGTMAYIADHPFSPIGLNVSEELFFGDSGPVEYVFRGSIALAFCVYVGWFRFVRGNMRQSSHAGLVLWLTVMFEIGYSIIPYTRFFMFMPFVIAYLNALPGGEHRRRR